MTRERYIIIGVLEDFLEEVINQIISNHIKERNRCSRLEALSMCAFHEQSDFSGQDIQEGR